MHSPGQSFAPGEPCSGVVRSIEPFGAVVALPGGIEGVVLVPELSWRPLRNVTDVVTVGRRIRTTVLGADLWYGKVLLTLRGVEPDPFPQLVELVGRVVTGPVTRLTPIGAFVRIEARPDGFEGLLAGAGISASCPDVEDAVPRREGQLVHVVVACVDLRRRRIELSAVARGGAAIR